MWCFNEFFIFYEILRNFMKILKLKNWILRFLKKNKHFSECYDILRSQKFTKIESYEIWNLYLAKILHPKVKVNPNPNNPGYPDPDICHTSKYPIIFYASLCNY